MPISPVFVTRFVQLVTGRQFAEAARVLERLKERMERTEWNRGYFRALYGILLASRYGDDQCVFLLRINLNNKEELQNHRREFLRHARNRLHADYDRGFFSAWADYMRILSKMELGEGKAPGVDEKKA